MGLVVTSYITRHWRGELPLHVSFWVNGVLFHFSLAALFIVAMGALYSDSPGPEFYLLTCFVILALRLTIAVWQLIGIWRSAQSSGWFAKTARFCVRIGWIYVVATGVATTIGVIGSIGNLAATYTK